MSVKLPTKENEVNTEPTVEAPEKNPRSEKKKSVLSARRAAGDVSKKKLMARGSLLTAAGVVLLMAILFAASALLSFEGAFTIKTRNPTMDKKAISLSETIGFANPAVKLSAIAINSMDNITYDWLPLEELDARDGSHNGENYIDYTYYIRNSGEETLDYLTEINVVKCTLAVDEAVRVMVFLNGEPTIYAKKAADGTTEIFPEGLEDFYSDAQVMRQVREKLAPGQADRWTVVAWLEGEDPECVNNILGGTLKMEMDFTILDENGEVPEDLIDT